MHCQLGKTTTLFVLNTIKKNNSIGLQNISPFFYSIAILIFSHFCRLFAVSVYFIKFLLLCTFCFTYCFINCCFFLLQIMQIEKNKLCVTVNLVVKVSYLDLTNKIRIQVFIFLLLILTFLSIFTTIEQKNVDLAPSI